MINAIITYIFIGVVFNLVFDLIVSYLSVEEQRFTFGERLTTTLLWPIALTVFVFNFIKTFFGK